VGGLEVGVPLKLLDSTFHMLLPYPSRLSAHQSDTNSRPEHSKWHRPLKAGIFLDLFSFLTGIRAEEVV